MKRARVNSELTMSEKTVWNGPGSLWVQPPMAMKHLSARLRCFSDVNRENSSSGSPSIGTIWKLPGVTKANEKYMWVNAPTGILSIGCVWVRHPS